jgi:ADP-ribosylglycohydrolase
MYRIFEYNLSRVGSATRRMHRETLVPKPPSTRSSRAAGALLGLAAGRTLALEGGPDGSLDLARILAEELAAGRRDLRALAHRWVERARADARGVDAETAAALAHLARHDAPPARAAGQGSDPVVRAVPVALAAFDAPRTLVSATYHIAALTHPDPLVAWSAVALNVALARFVQGKGDFVPDVVEALRNNAVPDELLARVRRVPLPGAAVTGGGTTAGSAPGDVEAALRLAYHEPLLERGLRAAAAGPGAAGLAALSGALLGARDSVRALPASWISPADADFWGALAARLVRAEMAAVPR